MSLKSTSARVHRTAQSRERLYPVFIMGMHIQIEKSLFGSITLIKLLPKWRFSISGACIYRNRKQNSIRFRIWTRYTGKEKLPKVLSFSYVSKSKLKFWGVILLSCSSIVSNTFSKWWSSRYEKENYYDHLYFCEYYWSA